MRLKLSNIKIEKVENRNDGLMGFCEFVVDRRIRFDRIAIFSRLDGGIRLAWPELTRGNKKLKLAHPINDEVRIAIESQVLEAYLNEEQLNANTNTSSNN